MDDSLKYLNPRNLVELQGLELKARHIVEGWVTGMHRSHYHGASVEFAEHREYVPGDDLRYLDWKAYGKSDRFFVKEFEEETNFACQLVLDHSESMDYRYQESSLSKLDYARVLVAALANLIVRQQDAIGLTTFAEEVTFSGHRQRGQEQLKRVLNQLEQLTPDGKTNVGTALHEIAERFRHRGLVIIVSDFFDDIKQLERGLQHLKHEKHDVLLFQILDAAERDFPFQSLTQFQGLENETIETEHSGDILDPVAIRAAYLTELQTHQQELRRMAHRFEFEFHTLITNESLISALPAILAHRH